jgi:hypothetical protein
MGARQLARVGGPPERGGLGIERVRDDDVRAGVTERHREAGRIGGWRADRVRDPAA